jgi:hypothetical protein
MVNVTGMMGKCIDVREENFMMHLVQYLNNILFCLAVIMYQNNIIT